MQKINYADYLHSADNVMYTEWLEMFAFIPRETVTGNRVWMRKIYTRRRTLLQDLPQFPVNAMDQNQYATLEEIMDRKFRGLP